MWAPGVAILVSHFHGDWSVSWCTQINLDLRFTHRKKKSVNRCSLSREAQPNLFQMPPLLRSFPWSSYLKQLSAGYSHSLYIFLFLLPAIYYYAKTRNKTNSNKQQKTTYLFMQLLSIAPCWKVNSTRTGSLLVLFSGVPPAPTLLCLFLA